MAPHDVRIEMQRRFPVSIEEGFDYITDPARWPEYWPRFVRLDPSSRWRSPGDRARITLRMLGRDVELDMTLGRIEPRRLVEYTSEQRGLPGARHSRSFEDADGELDYRVAVEYSPRPGWRGVLDRTVVRRAIARSVDETMANLGRLFA
jgi:uncharacterized protein YndB with AHSA1/START domain